MDWEKVFKKSKDVVTRDIEGQVIIMPLCKSLNELKCVYTLNKGAALVWELINGKNSLADIKKALLNKFHVNEDVVNKQLVELIKDLRSVKVIS
jgi:hypothetical protein